MNDLVCVQEESAPVLRRQHLVPAWLFLRVFSLSLKVYSIYPGLESIAG